MMAVTPTAEVGMGGGVHHVMLHRTFCMPALSLPVRESHPKVTSNPGLQRQVACSPTRSQTAMAPTSPAAAGGETMRAFVLQGLGGALENIRLQVSSAALCPATRIANVQSAAGGTAPEEVTAFLKRLCAKPGSGDGILVPPACLQQLQLWRCCRSVTGCRAKRGRHYLPCAGVHWWQK